MDEDAGIALAAAAWASIGSVITRKAATPEAAAESCRNDRRDLGEEDQGEEPFCEDMIFTPFAILTPEKSNSWNQRNSTPKSAGGKRISPREGPKPLILYGFSGTAEAVPFQGAPLSQD